MTIVIVDYGMGNLFCIYNALDYVGGNPRIVRDPEGLDGADGIVVPGVGAFGSCMSQLSRFESSLLRNFQGREYRCSAFALACRCSSRRAKRVPALRAWAG